MLKELRGSQDVVALYRDYNFRRDVEILHQKLDFAKVGMQLCCSGNSILWESGYTITSYLNSLCETVCAVLLHLKLQKFNYHVHILQIVASNSSKSCKIRGGGGGPKRGAGH